MSYPIDLQGTFYRLNCLLNGELGEFLSDDIKIAVEREGVNRLKTEEINTFFSSFFNEKDFFLSEIFLESMDIDDKEFKPIVKRITEQTRLLHVSFMNNNITDKELKYFAKNIKKVRSGYLIINFMYNKIGPGLEEICKEMRDIDNLGILVESKSHPIAKEIKEITEKNSAYHFLLDRAALDKKLSNQKWEPLPPVILTSKKLDAILRLEERIEEGLSLEQKTFLKKYNEDMEDYASCVTIDHSRAYKEKTKKGMTEIEAYIENLKIKAINTFDPSKETGKNETGHFSRLADQAFVTKETLRERVQEIYDRFHSSVDRLEKRKRAKISYFNEGFSD